MGVPLLRDPGAPFSGLAGGGGGRRVRPDGATTRRYTGPDHPGSPGRPARPDRRREPGTPETGDRLPPCGRRSFRNSGNGRGRACPPGPEALGWGRCFRTGASTRPECPPGSGSHPSTGAAGSTPRGQRSCSPNNGGDHAGKSPAFRSAQGDALRPAGDEDASNSIQSVPPRTPFRIPEKTLSGDPVHFIAFHRFHQTPRPKGAN